MDPMGLTNDHGSLNHGSRVTGRAMISTQTSLYFLCYAFWVIKENRDILLMEEILHHLGCMKPCRKLDILQINWCRISSINSSELSSDIAFLEKLST